MPKSFLAGRKYGRDRRHSGSRRNSKPAEDTGIVTCTIISMRVKEFEEINDWVQEIYRKF